MRLLNALFAQLCDQLTHLFARGAVHAFYRGVTGRWVGTRRHISIAALLISHPQQAMLVTQALDTRLELWRDARLSRQLPQDALYLTLALFELSPVFVQFCGLFATHEDIFPLLNLHFELQVGFID